jgi:hypothetical protein
MVSGPFFTAHRIQSGINTYGMRLVQAFIRMPPIMAYTTTIFWGILGVLLFGTVGYVLIEGHMEMKEGTLSTAQHRIGGQCTYTDYKGGAKIVSIIKKSDAEGGYQLKFLFVPGRQIKEGLAQEQIGREITMTSKPSYPAGFLEQYVRKFDIKAGKVLDCTMKVIATGTCTPIVYEFPFTRLHEYFD